jgi:hypothetical protein
MVMLAGVKAREHDEIVRRLGTHADNWCGSRSSSPSNNTRKLPLATASSF